ncbi:MAG: transposase [Verrucomicrobiaceae bacterium]
MNRTTEPTENRARAAQYDAAFREQAVSLLEEGTRSITALARELGVSHKTLSKWRQRHRAAAAAAHGEQTSLRVCSPSEGARGPVALAAELASLRAELRHVTIQRDILKKALAIVNQTSPTATR